MNDAWFFLMKIKTAARRCLRNEFISNAVNRQQMLRLICGIAQLLSQLNNDLVERRPSASNSENIRIEVSDVFSSCETLLTKSIFFARQRELALHVSN